MTDKLLSPATSAILDAYWEAFNAPLEGAVHRPLAAALRAAADQVAPSDAMEPRNHIPMALECQRIRKELLAIAAELDNTSPPS
jgi:hypothetical protein